MPRWNLFYIHPACRSEQRHVTQGRREIMPGIWEDWGSEREKHCETGWRREDEFRWMLCWIVIGHGQGGLQNNDDNNAWPVPWSARRVRTRGCAWERKRETLRQTGGSSRPINTPRQQRKTIGLWALLGTTVFTFISSCTKKSITHNHQTRGMHVCVQPIYPWCLRCHSCDVCWCTLAAKASHRVLTVL